MILVIYMFVLLFMCSYFIYQPFFYLFTSNTLHRNISYKQRFTLTNFLDLMMFKFEYTNFKEICSPRSLVYPKI